MAAGVTIEILDLRHFAAPVLRPVLDAEGELWSKRLHWDYRASARLLMQYLDNHLLPGYAALEAGQVTGYAFCVYEETKAVIGDVFALPGKNPESACRWTARSPRGKSNRPCCAIYLKRCLTRLTSIGSNLSCCCIPSGTHSAIFRDSGFEIYPRHFMVQQLAGHWSQPRVDLPGELELRPGAMKT